MNEVVLCTVGWLVAWSKNGWWFRVGAAIFVRVWVQGSWTRTKIVSIGRRGGRKQNSFARKTAWGAVLCGGVLRAWTIWGIVQVRFATPPPSFLVWRGRGGEISGRTSGW